MSTPIVIRPREHGDIPALADALVRVHSLDGYPVEGVADPEGWLHHPNELPRSPIDLAAAGSVDIAYVARRTDDGRTITHVAGLHAIGSLGAMDYLTAHAPRLYATTVGHDFSLLVESTHDGLTITGSTAVGAPLRWDR